MADAPSAEERRRWLGTAEAWLTESLEFALGDRLRREGSRPADGQRWIVITAYDLGAPCPARWAHPPTVSDYVDSAANSARRLGRLALRSWRPGRSLTVAVNGVLADTDDWPDDLRSWFETLDRAGRATVAAAAVSWAAGALGAVRGRGDLSWSRSNQPYDVPGRAVRLSGSWDALAGSRRRPAALLVMSNAAPVSGRDDLAAGFQALVCGLGPKMVPERVRIGSAAAGTARPVTITEALLDAAVDRIVELVAFRADPDGAPARPGRWCARCHLLEDCEEGMAAASAPE